MTKDASDSTGIFAGSFNPRLTQAEVRDLFIHSARIDASAKRIEVHDMHLRLADATLALEAERQAHRQTAHALASLESRIARNSMIDAHASLCLSYASLCERLNLEYGIDLAKSAVDDVTGEVRRLPPGPEELAAAEAARAAEPVSVEPAPTAPKPRRMHARKKRA